jgi:hypothetical protein
VPVGDFKPGFNVHFIFNIGQHPVWLIRAVRSFQRESIPLGSGKCYSPRYSSCATFEGDSQMARDANTTQRLKALLTQVIGLTQTGELHWERQLGSAHRYARWKNNLLIVGPAAPLSESNVPRYLFITPFDSPSCIEVNSDDEELGKNLMELVALVEQESGGEPPTDPFSIDEDVLNRLTS